MKKIFVILLLILSKLSFSYGIQPMYFEKNIKNGNGYAEIYILNTNKLEKGRYKITIGEGSNPKKDISKFVEIYPKVLNVAPDSKNLVKVYVSFPKELETENFSLIERDEYSFMFQITPIIIPIVENKNKELSANMNIKLAMNVEMYGHYGEAIDDEIQKGIKLENYEVYEKRDGVYLKGTLTNNLWYGFVPAIRVESEYGTKVDSREVNRLPKKGGKANFDYKLKNFNKKSEVNKIVIYDLINYRPLKEFKVKSN